jgi:hypothetical protein
MQSKNEFSHELLLNDLKNFGNFCKSLHGQNGLDESLENLKKESAGLHENVDHFRNLLLATPVYSVIQQWMLQESASAFGQKIIEAFETFYKQQIFPLQGNSGDIFKIEDLRSLGHAEIIERIRCIPAVRLGDRENMIDIYIHFAKFLSYLSFGALPLPVDPDRKKTAARILPLEDFWEFCGYLSERDSLIAAIMYYTGHILNEVATLKVGQIDPISEIVHFERGSCKIPKHIRLRLNFFLFNKKSPELLFPNRSGAVVNRAHVFIAFQKASGQMKHPRKITPKNLVFSVSV